MFFCRVGSGRCLIDFVRRVTVLEPCRVGVRAFVKILFSLNIHTVHGTILKKSFYRYACIYIYSCVPTRYGHKLRTR
jgi:hypothetical protein